MTAGDRRLAVGGAHPGRVIHEVLMARVPPAFWGDFVKTSWNQKPVVLPGNYSEWFPSQERIFQALVGAAERDYATGAVGSAIDIYLESDSIDPQQPVSTMLLGTGAYLPVAADASIEQYTERVTRELQHRFALLLIRYHEHDFAVAADMRAFFDGLYRAAGVPATGASIELIIGNYRRTWGRIHKDDGHVFTYVVTGRKRMKVWPYEVFAGRRENRDSSPDKAGLVILQGPDDEALAARTGSVLEGGPGELFYFPASYWHCAEPSEDLVVTLAIDFSYGGLPRFADLENPLSWSKDLRGFFSRDQIDAGLPLARGTRFLRRPEILNQLIIDLNASWLRYTTSGFFNRASLPLPPVTLDDLDQVQADPERPIVAKTLPEHQLILAANGQTLQTIADPKVKKLVTTLNAGKGHQVGALTKKFSGTSHSRGVEFESSPDAIRAVLEQLCSWRALRVERAKPSA